MNVKRMGGARTVVIEGPLFGGAELHGLVDSIRIEPLAVDREVGRLHRFGKGDHTPAVDVSAMVKVSFGSFTQSGMIGTRIVLLVSPAAKARVPLTAL